MDVEELAFVISHIAAKGIPDRQSVGPDEFSKGLEQVRGEILAELVQLVEERDKRWKEIRSLDRDLTYMQNETRPRHKYSRQQWDAKWCRIQNRIADLKKELGVTF